MNHPQKLLRQLQELMNKPLNQQSIADELTAIAYEPATIAFDPATIAYEPAKGAFVLELDF
jgi:hypothetical protein